MLATSNLTKPATSPLTVRGKTLAPHQIGFLRDSSAINDDADALRAHLEEDGYLFLRGYLNRDEVRAARAVLVQRLADSNVLDPNFPPDDAIANTEKNVYFAPDLAKDNPQLMTVLYDGAMMALYARLFGEAVRPFDFTWLRAVSPGGSTAPHCDVVYMGRGTHELLTAWTPLSDIPLSMGGLIVLENSHNATPLQLAEYLKQDVDAYCANGPNAESIQNGKMGWEHWDGSFAAWDGSITHDVPRLQEQLGCGRWLTAEEYRMGDLLTFTMRTIHGSLDNRSDRIRLSSDTRYQPASLPIDERWVGDTPIGHSLAGKRGKIC